MKPITFSVSCSPVPQPRPRVSTRGGFARAYTPKDHPVVAFRSAIASAAKAAGAKPVTHTVQRVIDAVYERPKSHMLKSGVKPSAPETNRHDVDNVAKAVMDALNGVAWADDCQVRRLLVEKSWGDASSVTVRITR
jgi:Holliday junction resolvase RusA-like endonuclease